MSKAFQPPVLVHELFLRFPMIRIIGNAVDRAHRLALRNIKVPHAFGATLWIDFIDHWPFVNGFIRADGLADIAIDALVGDFQCHERIGINFKQL